MKSKRKLKTTEKHMKTKTMIQNFGDVAKAILREKLIAKQAHLKKLEKSQINHLNLYLKASRERRHKT